MTTEEINKLIEKYTLTNLIVPDTDPWQSQYDMRSAQINYAMVREYKPKVIVEFGTRGGRCTHDIMLGLLANGGDFIYKPYELEDDFRARAQNNLNNSFGKIAPIIGGNIMKATDLPDNIDYLFVDNYHDYDTTKWVFEYLLPKKCKPGCLVQFHDLVIYGNFEFTLPATKGIPEGGEMLYFYEQNKLGRFPLEKIYWTWEEKCGGSSTWWKYQP
jgi:predicted O-methyltransferase YrrM